MSPDRSFPGLSSTGLSSTDLSSTDLSYADPTLPTGADSASGETDDSLLEHALAQALRLDGDDDAAVQDRLRGRLGRLATGADLDVAYRTVETPVGEMLLATTDVGVVRLAFAVEGFDSVLELLAARIGARVLLAPARLDVLARELDEFFAGDRRSFDLPLDLRLTTGFRREVVTHLPEIPYGRTASYAVVAGMAGSPRAVRAVGTACAKNPLPLVVPCHRVVRSDGTIGQYAGGPEAKRWLLDLEAGR